MNLKTALTFGLSLVASSAIAAPKPAIDARSVAAFEAAIAHYQKLSSFSVVANQKVSGAEKPRFTRLECSLQFPFRARLKMDTINAAGQVGNPLTRRLIGPKAYLVWDLFNGDFEPNANKYSALKSESERAQALADVFLPAPDLALSIFSFAARINPAKAKFVARATFQHAREDGRAFDKITVTRREPRDSNPIVLEYYLLPRTHEMRKFVLRRSIKGKNMVAVTHFTSPKANWKGSQSATDAAIYNWKTIALSGVPAPAFRPKSVVKVDEKARKIFARAADFYSPLDSLRIEWNEKLFDPGFFGGTSTETFKMAWERRGRLRLEDSQGIAQVVVVDDKTKSSYDASGLIHGEKATFRVERFDGYDAEIAISTELELNPPAASSIGEWLQGTNPLDDEAVSTRVDAQDLLELRAIILAPQKLDGTLCDIVRITTRFDDKYTTARGHTIKQETFWLAQKDGRLMRVQIRSQEGNQKPRTSDIQITIQEPNAKFDAATFVFKKPVNAVVTKD